MPNPGWSSGNGKSAGAGATSSSGRMTINTIAGRVNSAKTISSGSYGSGSGYLDLLRSVSDQNNAFNMAQVNAVNAFNAQEAQKNRDWQERMTRNAHQYEVEDLIKAGLNPVLSAGGQGAVVGSGGVASGQKAVADSVYGNGVMSLMSSMIAASSAQSIAQLQAATTMRGQDITRVNQEDYLKVLRQNNSANIFSKFGQKILDLLPGLLSKLP